VNEEIRVIMSVVNPMKIPLVANNVELLYRFELQAGELISEQEVEHEKQKVQLEPSENRKVLFRLTPRQPGTIKISHIRYEWNGIIFEKEIVPKIFKSTKPKTRIRHTEPPGNHICVLKVANRPPKIEVSVPALPKRIKFGQYLMFDLGLTNTSRTTSFKTVFVKNSHPVLFGFSTKKYEVDLGPNGKFNVLEN
jgi:hypothetical protein